ncbi:MAG: aminotransferase class I/II-fold pyridoxal phosphate-dependent enzyme, partial [Pseudomonadales bacterium]|nr:aminotransferase class I/II-fold pyridoxal phosphate-dependent enzyme [Pseudomonadales bacterium]
MSYERHNIESMSGYVPGEQPTAADVIKLNTNENPYPASAAVAEALAAIRVEDLRRYPSPTAQRFRQLAAAYHGLDSDNIIPTNGGDELLRLAITTFAGPGEVVGIAEPSYSLYPV